MGSAQNLIYFLLFLGPLIVVHELGHFLAAKWAGVKVEKFSVGFGQKLFSFRRGETEYQIAMIPMGGYVKMAGQYPGEDVPEGDQDRAFLSAPWWKRMVILVAGATFNLIFALFAYFAIALGDHEMTAPRVNWVEAGYPAAVAGIQPGDLVKTIDGKPIRAFEEIRPSLEDIYDRAVPITIERDGQELVLQITPRVNEESTPVEKVKRGLLGISSVPLPTIIGVPEGSTAHAAGLRTFDRVLSVNGEVVDELVKLTKLLDRVEGQLEVVVVRNELKDAGHLIVNAPRLVTVTMPRQPGHGLEALGAEPGGLYVWTVLQDSPAEKAGIKVGDRLVSLGQTQLASWYSVQQALKAAGSREFEVVWRSGVEEHRAQVSQVSRDVFDDLKNKSSVPEFGVRPRLAFTDPGKEILAGIPAPELVTVHRGVGEALSTALRAVPGGARVIVLFIGKMVSGEVSTEVIGSPIGIWTLAAKSAELGWDVFLDAMAMVSVNLAVVNLLPIPILDGFGIIAAAWEGIRRRPIPSRSREIANMVGFAMLLALVVRAVSNDIIRMFR